MLEVVCSVFLLTGLLMLPVRTIKNNILLLLLQSLSLSILAFLLSIESGFDGHAFLVGILTFAVKVILLPFILFRLAKKLDLTKERKTYVGPVLSVLIGLALAGLSYGYIVPVMLGDILNEPDLLAEAMATILFGCFYIVGRRFVLNQVIGIIMIENGLFLSALAITGGMPFIIELGIFFDVLIGVLVMGSIVFKISDQLQTLDNKYLNRLRG